LNERRSGCGNGVAFRCKRKTEINFVDPHQRLAGFDLVTNIHKPFQDLSGDSKAEVTFYLGPYDAREAAFGSADPRGSHQIDHRRFLPRVAHRGGFARTKGKCDESGRPERRDQNARRHNGSLFHGQPLG
jgi:hypothetical protein